MSGITIILSVLTNFIPFMSIFLIIGLPFVAALVAITCDLKMFPIYLVASLLLSIVVDAANFLNIIFYLLPSLVSGLVIGVTYRLKLNGLYMLLAVAFINFLANFAIIPILDRLYEIDFINYALSLIGLANHPLKTALFLLLLFVIALIQASFTYMIVSEEIHIVKGKIEEKYDKTSLIILTLSALISAVLTFFHLGLALVFFASSLVLVIYQLIYLFAKSKRYFYITIALITFLLPISFILAEHYGTTYLSFYLILIVLMVVIIMVLWEYIFSNKEQING